MVKPPTCFFVVRSHIRTVASLPAETAIGRPFIWPTAMDMTASVWLTGPGASLMSRISTTRAMTTTQATARYSGFLLNSLPPYWRTTDPAVVKAALKRLTG